MPGEYSQTDEFRGARFREADLTEARFRDCNLTDVSIASSVVTNLRVSGFGGSAGVVIVDDVDVSGYVESELDRRHPERAQVRAAQTADDFRAAWYELDRLWLETVRRAEQLPELARFESVDGEWSFAETLRHLVFAVDVWIDRMLGESDAPFQRFGLPPTDYPASGYPELGIELDADAPYVEIVALHADSRARVRTAVEAVTDSQLAEVRTAIPAPAWGVESSSVDECLRVVLTEHCEHRRFAARDLAVLESR